MDENAALTLVAGVVSAIWFLGVLSLLSRISAKLDKVNGWLEAIARKP